MHSSKKMKNTQPVAVQRRDGYQKPYDEKRVPSRLAAEYTNFGWVRARNKLSEEKDRSMMGVRLLPSQDKQVTEAIRRKKRFGMNARLRDLEWNYFKLVDRRDKKSTGKAGGGSTFSLILALLFLIVAAAFAVISFVPNTPTNAEDYRKTSKFEKALLDVRNTIDSAVFYGERYFVIYNENEATFDVQLDGKGGTFIALHDNAPIFSFEKDEVSGDKIAVNKRAEVFSSIELVTVNGKKGIEVISCERFEDRDILTNTYRYYIYNDNKGLLGFLADVIPGVDSIVWFGIAALVLSIVFFIVCGVCSGKKKVKDIPVRLEQLKIEAKSHINKMRREDPTLMTKAQRHFASWQRLIASSINMSGIAKNDNVEKDDFDDDEFDLFF